MPIFREFRMMKDKYLEIKDKVERLGNLANVDLKDVAFLISEIDRLYDMLESNRKNFDLIVEILDDFNKTLKGKTDAST